MRFNLIVQHVPYKNELLITVFLVMLGIFLYLLQTLDGIEYCFCAGASGLRTGISVKSESFYKLSD